MADWKRESAAFQFLRWSSKSPTSMSLLAVSWNSGPSLPLPLRFVSSVSLGCKRSISGTLELDSFPGWLGAAASASSGLRAGSASWAGSRTRPSESFAAGSGWAAVPALGMTGTVVMSSGDGLPPAPAGARAGFCAPAGGGFWVDWDGSAAGGCWATRAAAARQAARIPALEIHNLISIGRPPAMVGCESADTSAHQESISQSHGTYHPLIRHPRRWLLHHCPGPQGRARGRVLRTEIDQGRGRLLLRGHARHLPVWTRRRLDRHRRALLRHVHQP